MSSTEGTHQAPVWSGIMAPVWSGIIKHIACGITEATPQALGHCSGCRVHWLCLCATDCAQAVLAALTPWCDQELKQTILVSSQAKFWIALLHCCVVHCCNCCVVATEGAHERTLRDFLHKLLGPQRNCRGGLPLSSLLFLLRLRCWLREEPLKNPERLLHNLLTKSATRAAEAAA